ncbi:hypothetical protein F4780DRAFT_471145 [Xylariomycetidae sp. FL0641]|nr:hypothetical protein F4780DRAFT_471145 [Xylariomycetidae sp. FL0641]
MAAAFTGGPVCRCHSTLFASLRLSASQQTSQPASQHQNERAILWARKVRLASFGGCGFGSFGSFLTRLTVSGGQECALPETGPGRNKRPRLAIIHAHATRPLHLLGGFGGDSGELARPVQRASVQTFPSSLGACHALPRSPPRRPFFSLRLAPSSKVPRGLLSSAAGKRPEATWSAAPNRSPVAPSISGRLGSPAARDKSLTASLETYY